MSNQTELVTFELNAGRESDAKHDILVGFAVHIKPTRIKSCLACPFCEVKLEALRIFVREVQTVGTVPQCLACYRVFYFHLLEGELYRIQGNGTLYVVGL